MEMTKEFLEVSSQIHIGLKFRMFFLSLSYLLTKKTQKHDLSSTLDLSQLMNFQEKTPQPSNQANPKNVGKGTGEVSRENHKAHGH